MQILFDIRVEDVNHRIALTPLQDFNIARKVLLKLGKMIFHERQHGLRYFPAVRVSEMSTIKPIKLS
jgi:hypothetical protein